MSLHQSPSITPARLETHRQCARQSTGPRTVRGKAQYTLRRPERSLERAENKGYPQNHKILKLTTY